MPEMGSELTRSWNGTPISRRSTDGYVNATAMAKANGKEWFNYFKSDRATAYLEALAENLQTEVTSLYVAKQGEGTWIHPRLAVDFARWISPGFAVWMDDWFINELETRSSRAPEPAQSALSPIEHADKILKLVNESLNILDRLGGADERERMVYRDLVNNTVVRGSGNALLPPAQETITLAEALIQCGAPAHKATKLATRFGKEFKALYRKEHDGAEPRTHRQLVGGRECNVADYELDWVTRHFGRLQEWLSDWLR